MKLRLLFFLKSFLLKQCFAIRTEIPMIVDIIKSYDKPTAVVCKLCWNLSDKMYLSHSLMDLTFGKTVSFMKTPNELHKYNNIESLIIMDLECPDTHIFLEYANANHVFWTRWLMLPIQKYAITPHQLTHLDILTNTEVMVPFQHEEGKIMVYLVYRIDSTRSFREEHYGTWMKESGLIMSEVMQTSLLLRRKNLERMTITMSMVASEKSISDLYDLKYLDIDNESKVTFHQLLPVYEFMNATAAVIVTNSWGYFINNTWNGMIGDIKRGKAQLCGTLSFMRLDRLSVISFMTQSIPISSKIILRDPPLSFQNNLYLLPFKSTVWVCVGALTVMLIIMIYLNAKWEYCHESAEAKLKDPRLVRPNVSDITMYVVSAMSQQGSITELKGGLGRIVTFLMFLIFLFLYTSYSANIVALLQSSSDQIRTITDLLNSRLELGVEDVDYNRYYFPSATDPVRKALYDTKVAKSGYKPNFMSLEEGVRRLKNKESRFAFCMNTGTGYRLMEHLFEAHERCGLREIHYYPNSYPWLCSGKTSPYKEIFKVGAVRSLEHGLASRMNSKFFVKKPSCNTRSGSFASVNMVDFHPVLMMLLYGAVMALTLLVLEIITHRKIKKNIVVRDGE